MEWNAPSATQHILCFQSVCISLKFMLFMLSDVISHFYFWYFISSLNQTDTLRWKWVPVSMLIMFMITLVLQIYHEHQYSTAQCNTQMHMGPITMKCVFENKKPSLGTATSWWYDWYRVQTVETEVKINNHVHQKCDSLSQQQYMVQPPQNSLAHTILPLKASALTSNWDKMIGITNDNMQCKQKPIDWMKWAIRT
jgi:hypothetical protein